ncbi:AIPR family protein [Candidatus Omnitrophota bacterium]
MTLTEYYSEFMQDIYARAGAEKDFCGAIFSERMCEYLTEQAIIDHHEQVGFKKSTRGVKVDAWSYNPDTEAMHLFVADYRANKSMEPLTRTEIIKNFKRVEKFFMNSIKPDFHSSLEETDPGYALSREIYEKRDSISVINIVLLSNANLSSRVETIKDRTLKDYNVTHDIWDISRLWRIDSSKNAKEDIFIDFKEISKNGIPCLPAFASSENCESYLMVLPGQFISDIYEKYGERLLEQNVRTFLQFRGNVNKGIRNTIQNEPGMFFAYNNGLSITAEDVKINKEKNIIESVKNFQIVNGGQTVASIFMSMKKHKSDLSNVFVQIKLSVIPSEKIEAVVPRISEYANTQNKVSAADFFSNHPFHLRIEEISRRLWAPSSSGNLRETRWFYERARGQYANAQATLTPSQQKEFLAKYPRSQMFTKTDLAKFSHSVDRLPQIVSLGAQKNFAKFASDTGKKWDCNDKQFNELYFKELIAKALLFRFTDKLIMKQDWYGGYKANIVTYSISKLSQMIFEKRKCLDYDNIWNKQLPSKATEEQLLIIAEKVNDSIQNTPEGITNVTEWCKRELCWTRIKELKISLNNAFVKELVDIEEVAHEKKSAAKEQRMVNDIQNQTYVLGKRSEYWKRMSSWGVKKKLLTVKEMDILAVACRMPGKIPSEKQSKVLISIEKRIKKEGFFDL